MASIPIVADGVWDTSTTTSTGTYTLSGAAAQTYYQTFAVVGNSNSCYYRAEDRNNGGWENGIGTYTSSGTTLSRDTILASSNSGSAVSWSAGTRQIFLALPAEELKYATLPKGLTATGTKTSGTYNAVAGDLVVVDTTSSAVTVNLDATPLNNEQIGVYFTAATNNLTVGHNGNNIDGAASDEVLSLAGTFQVFSFRRGVGWVTVVAEGESSLASQCTITSASAGAFSEVKPDAGGTFTVVLPRAGMYKLGLIARMGIARSGGTDIYNVVKLKDGTNYLPTSPVIGNFYQTPDTGSHINEFGTEGIIYLASGATTIKMWAAWTGDGTPTVGHATVDNDSEGQTKIWYRLIG